MLCRSVQGAFSGRRMGRRTAKGLERPNYPGIGETFRGGKPLGWLMGYLIELGSWEKVACTGGTGDTLSSCLNPLIISHTLSLLFFPHASLSIIPSLSHLPGCPPLPCWGMQPAPTLRSSPAGRKAAGGQAGLQHQGACAGACVCALRTWEQLHRDDAGEARNTERV